MRPPQPFGDVEIELGDVTREKQLPEPVESDLHLPGQGRHLAKVDAAPEEPRRKSGNLEAKNLADRLVVADGGEHAERFVGEWARLLTSDCSNNVVGQSPC